MDRFLNEYAPWEGANGGKRPVGAIVRGLTAFGSNPGHLHMHLHLPSHGGRRRPLVVVLHGCTQTADGFDRASGWSKLGEKHGFLVLFPEQNAAKNPKLCFSWFRPEDTRRGSGEVESIRQMIAFVLTTHDADPDRVFICGLSAGGAMTGAMLAAYPEVFAGGAIIAGLPYGVTNVHEALDLMATGRVKEAKVWGDAVRGASPTPERWPAVSIWHGTADTVVKPINAGELVKQWTNVHRVGAEVPAEDHIGRITRRVWRDRHFRPCVREYSVPDLEHGVPVDDAAPPAPFFLPAGVSATRIIARDWGLTGGMVERARMFFRFGG